MFSKKFQKNSTYPWVYRRCCQTFEILGFAWEKNDFLCSLQMWKDLTKLGTSQEIRNIQFEWRQPIIPFIFGSSHIVAYRSSHFPPYKSLYFEGYVTLPIVIWAWANWTVSYFMCIKVNPECLILFFNYFRLTFSLSVNRTLLTQLAKKSSDCWKSSR